MTSTALPPGLFTCQRAYPSICGGRSWTTAFLSPEPDTCINCYRKDHPPEPEKPRKVRLIRLLPLKLLVLVGCLALTGCSGVMKMNTIDGHTCLVAACPAHIDGQEMMILCCREYFKR